VVYQNSTWMSNSNLSLSQTIVLVGGETFPECLDVCGDGRIVGPEVCDDGNALSNDGCSANCMLLRLIQCPTAGLPCNRMLLRCGD